MKLSYDQICSAAQGAVRITEENGTIRFFRFTDAEQQMYKKRREESWLRSFATAGIRLEFDTDSTTLTFAAEIRPSTSRRWFAHSIFADGERIGEIAGEIPEDAPMIHVQKQFELKLGKKRVVILLPWSVESRLEMLCLGDGASFEPVKKACRLLAYGDSITQGYDAEKPEEAYIVQLVDWLNAELICKAIGGERFCPQLAELCEVADPALITVAYGSNDWRLSELEEFLQDSQRFFRILADRFSGIPLIALAPVWRIDADQQTHVGHLDELAAYYQGLSEQIPNMTVIDCFDFVPHNTDYYRDRRVHPNDMGFQHYANALIKAVKAAWEQKDNCTKQK